MRHQIIWNDSFPEAAGWYGLPQQFRDSLDRKGFLDELDCRRKRFVHDVSLFVKNIAAQDQYLVIESGDWHRGSCVLVLRGSNTAASRMLVVKPRCNEAALFLRSLTDQAKLSLEFGVSIPFIKIDGNFWIQEHAQSCDEKTLSSRNVGGIIATTLWGGLTDLHDENLVINDLGVHLIDTECAFSFSAQWSAEDCINASGLITGKAPGLNKVKICDYSIHAIGRALRAGLNALMDTSPIGLYEKMDHIRLRRVLIATRIYMAFLRQRFLFGWTDVEMEKRWRHLRTANPAAESIVSCEIQELKNWDVPIFYQLGHTMYGNDGVVQVDCEAPSVAMRRIHKMLANDKAVESLVFEIRNGIEKACARLPTKGSKAKHGGAELKR